jgi:hypothetical protein
MLSSGGKKYEKRREKRGRCEIKRKKDKRKRGTEVNPFHGGSLGNAHCMA